jgi:D-alanyl-D-alanine carboxypeptidase
VSAPFNPVKDAPKTTPKPVNTPKKPSFNKQKYSTTDPSSIWVVANKTHPLSPVNYAPTVVESNGAVISSQVLEDFNALISDATANGLKLTLVSSYRSYATQNYLYNNYVAKYGQAMADTFSAKPGYSEHQTGLAIDFGSGNVTGCNLEDCFGTTKEGVWLKENAWHYGFLLRYPLDKQEITGYKSEPWHYRYIGHELSTEMHKENSTTLEEFFNISGGVTYI